MFEYSATIPAPEGKTIDTDAPEGDIAVDGKVSAKTVVLKLRSYGDAPGGISRHNIGDTESQVWGYLEWGLVEPVNYPEGSTKPGANVFDVIPQRQITDCYQQWQKDYRLKQDRG